MAKITVNEGLSWLRVLRQRQAELIALRDKNSDHETRFYGANADKQVEKKPVYDVKKLDTIIGRVSAEIRKVDSAIKRSNAMTIIDGYDQQEDVLGIVE